MTTDKIRIYSNGEGMKDALDIVDRYADYCRLPKKEAMHLRLLSEETIGMTKGITGSFEGDFWIEKDGDAHLLHLQADTYMNNDIEKELVSVSSKKQNEAAIGFMGKIRNIIEKAMRGYNDMAALAEESNGGPLIYGTLGMRGNGDLTTASYEWSLMQYRCNVELAKENNTAAEAAWDELEKSIVANLADDVRVGIQGNIINFTIKYSNN